MKSYLAWGIEALHKFDGMWAFVIYDKGKGTITLCRDQFGIKPIGYFENEVGFFVFSEVKQLLEVPQFTPELNDKIALNFLDNGLMNYSAETFFREVFYLEGGHFLTYSLLEEKYQVVCWDQQRNKQSWKRLKIPLTQARNTIESDFERRFNVLHKTGLNLSAGIDSNIIALLFKNSQNP